MTELAIMGGFVVAVLCAIFVIRKSGEREGRSNAQARADRRNLEAQERGRDAVHDARRDGRSNADRVRDNDAKW